MTKNQREFQRQIERLQRSINRLTKKEQFIQSQDLPTQPKRITKRMVKKLKELKGKDFVSELNIETGEVVRETKPVSLYKHKPKTKKYIPTFSVYDEIHARFEEAEQEIIAQYGMSVYDREIIQARVNHIRDLIDILEYKHNQYEEREQYGVYDAYLKTHEEIIAELLSPLIYSSDQVEVDYSYSELVRILSMNDDEILGEETLSRLAKAEEFMMEHGGE